MRARWHSDDLAPACKYEPEPQGSNKLAVFLFGLALIGAIVALVIW